MAKKRKLTKEEKAEIKNRESLGRLCRPGCTLVVYGKEMTAVERLEVYESGIRIMFTNDISEVTEFLETAVTLDIPVTLIVRSAFSENHTYFSVNIEPLLAYVGEKIDVKIVGNTPHDVVLDRLGVRIEDKNDRVFYEMLNKWSPYCADTLNYGRRMKALANNEEKAAEKREKTKIVAREVINTPHDPFGIMEQLSLCAEQLPEVTEESVAAT